MAYEIAKLLLEKADTFIKRKEAIRTAFDLGMPFKEIEEYLDWLDFVRRDDSNKSGPAKHSDDRKL